MLGMLQKSIRGPNPPERQHYLYGHLIGRHTIVLLSGDCAYFFWPLGPGLGSVPVYFLAMLAIIYTVFWCTRFQGLGRLTARGTCTHPSFC